MEEEIDKSFQRARLGAKDPRQWGGCCWSFLEHVALSYPMKPTENQKKNMHKFITSLADVLPCAQCANHLKSYLEKNPPSMNSSHALCKWIHTFHNEVNARLEKEEVSFLDFLQRGARQNNATATDPFTEDLVSMLEGTRWCAAAFVVAFIVVLSILIWICCTR